MAKYNLTVPDSANSFQHGTDSGGNPVTHNAGSRYETDNPCDAIAFYNAARTTNPNIGRADRTPGFWAGVDADCQAQTAATPPVPPTSPITESNPAIEDVDSANLQGAPSTPPGGNTTGTETREPGSGDDTNSVPTEDDTRPPAGDPHPTHGGEQPQEQTNAGDPVDIFNGAFYLQETDLEIPNTVMPLAFTRFYRSGAASFGPFGWNWDHNFNLFLRELNNGDMALWRNLHEEKFKFDGANFEPQRGVFEKLERIPALAQVYEIKGEGGVIMRFERPAGWIDGERIPIVWLKDRHGNQLQFTYGAEDKLAEVRDDDDRFFKFDYDQCGLLVAVSDHSGRKFLYEHDEETMQLVFIKSPAISGHPNGITRIYHYEQPWTRPELRHNIVRVEDAQGNVYLENTYEQDPAAWSYARVTEQLYGGFLYQFRYTQLQFVPSNSVYMNIPSLRVEVMNPDYGLETYTFNYRGDLLDRRYRLNKDKSFRVVVWQYEFDEQGNPTKTTKPDGSEILNVFDFANADPRMRGKLLRKELTSASGFPSPSRIIWRGKYEPVYQLLIEEKNETGATTSYKYDFNISPADPTNSGKLIELLQPDATLPDGTVQTAKNIFEYNSKGQPTAFILPNGIRNDLRYGTTGNEKSRLIKQVFDAGGIDAEEKFMYDVFGFAAEKVDRNGNISRQEYNELGLPEKTILPAVNGIVAEYLLHYDSDLNVISFERPKGDLNDAVMAGNHIIDQFERDILGFPVKYKLSSNTSEERILNVTNNYRGFPVETINPDGSKLRTAYDERGLLLNEDLIGIDGKKISTKRVYDRSGKISQETSVQGLITKYEYEGFSRVSKIILSNGTEIKKKWLPLDLLESEETIGDDGNGTIRQLSFKSFTYDEKNRKITETIKSFTDDPAVFTNVKTTFFYDNMDRIVSVVSNRDGISTIQYDPLGRLSFEADPMGNEVHYFYDHNGNLIKTESHHMEPDGTVSVFTKDFEYDSRNRRTASIEPDGSKVISRYDDRNLLVSLTDQHGIVREMFYDSFNNKLREIEDSGGLHISKQWTVDNMSRITSFIDPMGQISSYSFDSLGHNIRVEYPNGFISNKIFNDKNQVVKEQLGSGVEFVYEFDSSNRIIKIENTIFPSSLIKVDTHEFSYDGLDRVLSANAGTHIVERKYDSQSRLLEETTQGNTISCSYNDNTGEVVKTWPDGRSELLTHDLNGVLTKLEETVNGTLGSGNTMIATFRQSGANFLEETIYNSGISIKNSYDDRKRLTSVTATSPAGLNESIEYRYNAANIAQVEAISGLNPKLNYFEFDKKYRLLDASNGFVSSVPNAANQSDHDAAIAVVKAASAGASHQEKFLYNASDARIQYTETGLPDKNYTYQPGYRIQNDGSNTYSHFTDGTLRSDGIFTYEADALGRILKIKSASATITEISYDALGRPSVVKEIGKPDKSFNYLGVFVEQENENGTAVRQISIHPDTGIPLAYHSSSGSHYTLFDSRFNLTALLDSSGNLVESYRYKAFGQPQIFDNLNNELITSALGINPIYGGQRYIDSVGLYLSTRRLLNPVNGSYLSPDPFDYFDSSSLYVYVKNNPINLIDPEGELAWFVPILIGVAIGGGISAVANWDKSGTDFWVSVLAGAAAGGIMGTGYGLVSFAAGGLVGGAIQGGYENGLEGAAVGGGLGLVGGLAGGYVGGRIATSVSGRLYGTAISRGLSTNTSTQVSQYTGTGLGGFSGGFTGNATQQSAGYALAGENPFDHMGEIGADSLRAGGYGLFGGVSNKAAIQGYSYFRTNSFSGMLGAEAEFYVQNQTLQRINSTQRVPNTNGNSSHAKIPDLYGRIIGDVKNTASIPSLNAQNNQLRSINQAAINQGQRMQIFNRPGVTAGPRSQVGRNPNIDLTPIRQHTPIYQPMNSHPNDKPPSSK
jgi:RHS repeat-associated protein